MPHQTLSNEIGRQGERWFVSQLPDSWIFQKPTEDIGIDGTVVICEKGKLNGYEFRVQIKSCKGFTIQNDYLLFSGIKRSSLVYWLAGLTPTLFVGYEASSKSGFFYWINKLAGEQTSLFHNRTETVTLKVPRKHIMNGEGWAIIKKDIALFTELLQIAIKKGQQANLLLPTLHEIHKCLNSLFMVHSLKPNDFEFTEKQIFAVCQIEISIHKRFVTALKTFFDKVKPSEELEAFLAEMYKGYIGVVSLSILNFQELFSGTDNTAKYAFEPQQHRTEREVLITTITEILCKLTDISSDEKNGS